MLYPLIRYLSIVHHYRIYLWIFSENSAILVCLLPALDPDWGILTENCKNIIAFYMYILNISNILHSKIIIKFSVMLKQLTWPYIYCIYFIDVGPHVYTLKFSFISRYSRYPWSNALQQVDVDFVISWPFWEFGLHVEEGVGIEVGIWSLGAWCRKVGGALSYTPLFL